MEELREKHEWELQCIRSFGNKSLREVKDALDRIENMTNGDRIRDMNDDELAEFLCSHMAHCDPRYCPGEHLCGCEEGKASGLKLWLSQPARER